MFKKIEQLFNKTNIKIVKLLCENPLDEFYEREIAKEAGVSVGSANRILRELLSIGIVSKREKGRLHFYKINMNEPIVRQMKILFNITELGELIKNLKPFSVKIMLFGSAAEGNDTKDSDLDLFLLVEDKEKARTEIANARKKIERKISPIIMERNEYIKLKTKDKVFYDNINKGIILFDENELRI